MSEVTHTYTIACRTSAYFMRAFSQASPTLERTASMRGLVVTKIA